jgi:secondary thiamine-phosphate synthase enzyme
MRTLQINTTHRVELVDITPQIEEIVNHEKTEEGLCIITCPHTTAALTINENADPAVRDDIIGHLNEMVPDSKDYSHREGNADAHIKASLCGNSLQLIILEGRLVLGTWQGIYFCEFDGPRKRSLHVKVMKG